MKVVLLTLSGDESRARVTLLKHYPASEVVEISRGEFERGAMVERLRKLRALRPDVFAVATERLAWQRGQNALLLFGVLAGAHSAIMLDAHGGFRKESRSRLLFSSPLRLAGGRVLSAVTVARAKRDLQQLEKAARLSLSPQARRTASTSVDITYLRATPGPGTQAGGAASHIKGVTKGLLDLGAQVRIISNDAIAGLDEPELTIIEPEPVGETRAVFEIHNNSVFSRGALPLIEREPPDFIYQRYARFSTAGVVASLRTNRPLFLEYNGSEVWVGRHWDQVGMLDLLARYERLNLAAAARIFVVSEVERRNLERAGVAPQKIILNPNGVDTEVFRPGVGGDRVRRELAIDDDETLVGFVGSFGPWHGVLVLAEAIKLIPATSRIRFLLVGSGSLQARVKQLLSAEEQEGQVIFTDSVAHRQVPALLDACDVLVSPHVPLDEGTEFFGSPTKIFEYLAMAKGIVASRLGQLGDALTDEETALLVGPGDAAALAAATVRLAKSKQLREQLGAAARAAAIERHTWKRNAQNVLEAYREWLSEPN
jgi:glycosyltransferase involved in cell wall biosynthesis